MLIFWICNYWADIYLRDTVFIRYPLIIPIEDKKDETKHKWSISKHQKGIKNIMKENIKEEIYMKKNINYWLNCKLTFLLLLLNNIIFRYWKIVDKYTLLHYQSFQINEHFSKLLSINLLLLALNTLPCFTKNVPKSYILSY